MRIRWTEPAARDLTMNITAGNRVALQIYGGVGAPTQFAHRGRSGRKPGTRELMFPGLPFLAVYHVREDNVALYRQEKQAYYRLA